MTTNSQNNKVLECIKNNKVKVILLLMAIIVAIVTITIVANVTQNAKREEVYLSAIECLKDGNVEKSKELFGSLPDDYAISDFATTAVQWQKIIDAKYNSAFLGYWGNDNYSIEITQHIDIFGIDVDYKKNIRDGVLIYEGYLEITSPTQKSAWLHSSKNEYHYESGANNYKLVLVDDSTMEVYFKGELHTILKKANKTSW